MSTPIHGFRCFLSPGVMIAAGSLTLAPGPAAAQLTPGQVAEYRSIVGNQVEAITILGGDYGASGASFRTTGGPEHTELDLSKFGGAGDLGDPKPLGLLGFGWQPVLQGEMGFADAKTDFTSGDLVGDSSENKTLAIEFGGGARFWFNDHLSLAPTIMGMYGHTENDYTANNPNSIALLPQAQDAGLVNWKADTWTIRPAANLEYVQTWRRTVFTLSSEFAYFHTESFETSNPNLHINGDSEAWKNMLDVDIPLGRQLLGHELRTGGYFSRTDLYGDLKNGVNTGYVYELHGRLVLDFLGQLWKVKWIGVGASYLWGSNFDGWGVGADIQFKF